MRKNKYLKKLVRKVIELSESNTWKDAVTEWEIYDCDEDMNCSSTCVCGKENIKYLFTIINTYNGNKLFPIGSSCIKRFGREDLEKETSVYESIFKYSRTIKENKSNSNNHNNDYETLLNMINKKNNNITERQKNKIKDIVSKSVEPSIWRRKYPRWYKGAGIW